MVDYQIMGSNSGKERMLDGDKSAAKALGQYTAAKNTLPVTGVRILADGVEIGVGELLRRASAEKWT